MGQAVSRFQAPGRSALSKFRLNILRACCTHEEQTPGSLVALASLFLMIGTSQADSQSRPASRNSTKQQKWLWLDLRTLRLRYFTIRSNTASSKLRRSEAEPREAILFLTGPAFWERSIVFSSFQSALCLV
jgi:hypothetical protein